MTGSCFCSCGAVSSAGTVSSSGITNFSAKDLRRVDHTLTIPYAADFEAVKKLLEGDDFHRLQELLQEENPAEQPEENA